MCDTVFVDGLSSRRGHAFFAKNSDREPDEAQCVELLSGRRPEAGSRVRTTYLTLPEVAATHRVLLCRPFWMWGAEMGVNEHGVAIGNEAVFTRAPAESPALLGMDLVRLGLERAASAEAALDVITSLLEEHGQGGAAGYRNRRFRYDSSFIIADAGSGWVLETAGRAWVAKRVHGVRAISNSLTLRDDWDRASPGLSARARDWGLAPGRGKLDFARTFAKPLLARAANAPGRRACLEGALAARSSEVELEDVLAALRSHGRLDRPDRATRALRATVCAHAGPLPTRASSQTTGSLVVELGAEALAWVTGTSAPCLSVFRPLWPAGDEALRTRTPSARFDPAVTWWRHEVMHRLALGQLTGTLARLGQERDAVERRFAMAAWAAGSEAARRESIRHADGEAREFAEVWTSRLAEAPARLPAMVRAYFRELDEATGLAAAVRDRADVY